MILPHRGQSHLQAFHFLDIRTPPLLSSDFYKKKNKLSMFLHKGISSIRPGSDIQNIWFGL